MPLEHSPSERAGALHAILLRILSDPTDATPEQVEQRIAAARARIDLGAYGQFVSGHTPAPLHQRWIDAVTDPDTKRLLIVAPPDTAKTQWMGIHLPAWMIGNNTNIHVGLISNTAGQAQRKSVAVRDTILDNPKYRLAFPGVKPDYGKGWSESEWFVQREDVGDKDSTFTASGAPGPILGNRFDLLIFDDINDQENTSTLYQAQKLNDWVEKTALTRLVEGGRAVAIMTRWAHFDAASYFLEHGWTLLHTPALDDDGKSAWEERHPAVSYRALQADQPLTFEQVHQGRPTPRGGALLKQEWFRSYPRDVPPACERTIQVWDTAFKKGQANDYSVCAYWGATVSGYYLLDLWRARVEYPQLKALAVSFFNGKEPNAVLIEDAASGQSLIQDLRQTTRIPLHPIRPDKDKIARVNAIADIVASGRVFIPDTAPWLGEWLLEHIQFPAAEHDDMIDTTTMALEYLSRGRKLAGQSGAMAVPKNGHRTVEDDDMASSASITGNHRHKPVLVGGGRRKQP